VTTDLVAQLAASKLAAFDVRIDRMAERGHVYAIGDALYAEPLTAFELTHDCRLPLESRYSRGVLELQRDRRRHR
jgi:hypothetical protein